MSSTEQPQREWYKSSYSAANGSCVEVANGRTVLVRDTENRPLGHLDTPSAEWTAFLKAAIS